MATESRYSFATLHNCLRVTGTLVAQTALRIGAGRSSEVTGTDLPVLRDARGRPLIPGASIVRPSPRNFSAARPWRGACASPTPTQRARW